MGYNNFNALQHHILRRARSSILSHLHICDEPQLCGLLSAACPLKVFHRKQRRDQFNFRTQTLKTTGSDTPAVATQTLQLYVIYMIKR